jgi:hypothetical protein
MCAVSSEANLKLYIQRNKTLAAKSDQAKTTEIYQA